MHTYILMVRQMDGLNKKFVSSGEALKKKNFIGLKTTQGQQNLLIIAQFI